MRSSASSFNFHYLLVSLRLSNSCYCLLPPLPVNSIPISFNNVLQKAVPMYDMTNPVSFSSFIVITIFLWRPGSVVGIAIAYRLDGPGIESRWRRDFPHLYRPALRPTQPPVQWVPGLSRGKVRPGRDADPSPPSSAEVKNRVELYLYSS